MYETKSLSKFLSPLISFICGKDAISVPGIVCGTFWGSFQVLGSFAVQFGDHLRYWDHLRAGIICGPVQFSSSVEKKEKREKRNFVSPSVHAINKLTSVFHASLLLLIMNFVITLSKWLCRRVDPVTECYDFRGVKEIH